MPNITHYTPVDLSSTHATDLLHASVLIQDALCSVTSITFDKDKNTFSILLNRFCWEMCDHFDHHDSFFRVHSSLIINNVQAVFKRNYHQSSEVRNLNLLTVSLIASDAEQSVRLLFSGDMEIDLKISKLDVSLKDFGHPWPTHNKPIHLHEHMDELMGMQA